MDRTPGTDEAIEKMLEAITDDTKRDRYPSGTTFVGTDAPWSQRLVDARLSQGRSVVLVSGTGLETFITSFAVGVPTVGAISHARVNGYVSYATSPNTAETPETPVVAPDLASA